MKTSRWVGGGVMCMAVALAYGSLSDAQQPARQPTRRVDNQNQPGGVGGEGGGEQSATINRQQMRRVQGGPGNEAPVLDQQSGRFQIRRQVIRPGLRRLPPRPNARWRLGIQVDNAPKGLRISEVARNSPAFRFGLEDGDYLLDVMGYPVGFYGNAYYPLAETLNQVVRRDGWVNILVWNKRSNAEETMWIQAEPRQFARAFGVEGRSSEN